MPSRTPHPGPFLNLGIRAHVDAGKTSLTERLLFDAGVIDRLGSVDTGTTITDTLDQERRRGITIRSAVATFSVGARTVNLIDTPGHPDFIAEVERALRVLDGAILVVSAVEGVQTQTRILLSTLRRMHMPTLIFVNKTDRVGADPDRVLQDIPDAIATWADPATVLADLAEYDEGALAAFVEDRPTPPGTLQRLTASATVMPAFRGSAVTGDGIVALTSAIVELLPSADGSADAALRATVFAAQPDRTALIRVHEGTVRVRDRIGDGQVVAIDNGERDLITAGDIGRIRGLRSLRVGDTLGDGEHVPAVFPPPTHESTIRPVDGSRRHELHRALSRLAEQDPLIGLHIDPGSGELSVRLYGEVQKEVVRDTLAEDFGIDVILGETVTLLRERPVGSARAGMDMGDPANHHAAGLHLLAEPGDGVEVQLTAPSASIPFPLFHSAPEFRDALEQYVRASLRRGALRRWEVDGIRVTVTGCAWSSVDTAPADFRRLLHELLGHALSETGTVVCEPVYHVQVSCPTDATSAVLALAARGSMSVDAMSVPGASTVIDGTLRASDRGTFEAGLADVTRGRGTIEEGGIDWRPVGS